MGKTKNNKAMRVSSIFKSMESTTQQHHLQPWQWPSCKQQPKTLSFRAGDGDGIFKTVNSVFLDVEGSGVGAGGGGGVETSDSCFTNTSGSASFSTESEEANPGEAVEDLVRGAVLSGDRRLFFEHDNSKTSSILKEERGRGAVGEEGLPFKESVALAMASENPYLDFRRSMEEMVESHGLKDWDSLEELLSWYLRVNGKANHGLIIDAFIDLLISLSSVKDQGQNPITTTTTTTSTATTGSTSYSSAVSYFSGSHPSTSSSCTLKEGERNPEIKEDELS
ncbi:hypothetical protein MLD38_011258 [Melastoma candidum]|uniref:Uncharacterized protein n=1 Tax=Melastoma candidum TaxID=119954 RepID=A0ACB9R2H3_9MYRT|nr:hypothetical protein MLD38_011258 [Melastoma candidum]